MIIKKFFIISIVFIVCSILILGLSGISFTKLLEKIKKRYFYNVFEPKPLFTTEEKNFCINFKNPKELTTEQQLEEFIKGPCSPVILIPGMMGTSLIVEIDCETLQNENPNIFSVCGWNTCSSWAFWKQKPQKEYNLWLTDFFSPLSFFSISDQQHKCFNELIKVNFNSSSKIDEERYASPKGVRITWYGNSQYTKEYSHCGSSSVREIGGLFHLGCDSEVYGKLIKSLENLGYQNSLTLQALPYDFRKGVLYNNFENTLKKTLNLMNTIVHKKVTIVAHSLGNNYVLGTLMNMTHQDKDRLIFQYISIGAPFSGTLNALHTEISGFKEFQYFDILGLDFDAQKFFLLSPSLYESIPYDTFERFQNETWMKEVIKRVEEEKIYGFKNNESVSYWLNQNYSLSWFPSPLENCGNLLEKEKKCSSSIIDYLSEPLVTIENKGYFSKKQDLLDLISNFSISKNESLHIYQESIKNQLNLLKNPEVPMTIIYSSLFETKKSIIYKSDPNSQTNLKEDFYWDEEIIFGKGDGNVLTSFVLVPASKWIWEYKNKISNSKPIKIIEICSDYNSSSGEQIYQGQTCECLQENKDNCKHSCLISENGVIRSIFNVVKNAKISENPNFTEGFDYKNFEKLCFALAD